MDWAQIIKLTTGLFAVLNPLGGMTIFATMTESETLAEKRRIAGRTMRAVVIILCIAAVVGEYMLRGFGISLGAFRMGGGILLLLMALSMLQAKQSRVKHSPEESVEAQDREDIAIVPLAIPVLCGPGTISTIILYGHDAATWQAWGILLAIILVVSAGVYSLFYFAPLLVDRFGRTGLNIISRVMGLILAALAVEFMADGLKDLLPVLNQLAGS